MAFHKRLTGITTSGEVIPGVVGKTVSVLAYRILALVTADGTIAVEATGSTTDDDNGDGPFPVSAASGENGVNAVGTIDGLFNCPVGVGLSINLTGTMVLGGGIEYTYR